MPEENQKNEVKLIQYEHTLYDLLINEFRGKYFQNILFPSLIVHFTENQPFNCLEKGKLWAYMPLEEKWTMISLEDFKQYALISEGQFNKYKNDETLSFSGLSKIVLAQKDASIFKEVKQDNKANLSAEVSKSIIVDKSNAHKRYPLRETVFTKNSKLNH